MKVKTSEATKKDWIIMRLLVSLVQADPKRARSSGDVCRSLLFLSNKLGFDQVEKMIDALEGEMK